MEVWDTTAVTIGIFNLEVFSSASTCPPPNIFATPADTVLHLIGSLLLGQTPFLPPPPPKLMWASQASMSFGVSDLTPYCTQKNLKFFFFHNCQVDSKSVNECQAFRGLNYFMGVSVAVSLSPCFLLCPTIFHFSLAFYLVVCGACICFLLSGEKEEPFTQKHLLSYSSLLDQGTHQAHVALRFSPI